MAKDLMNYHHLAQDALRGVVRLALERVRDDGLPGSHHFYIAFQTVFPGVMISDVLKAQYPGEMTIVIQHQFGDLEVTQDHFEVTLSFNKVPERLSVPFQAITSFYDPSVQFGIRFERDGDGDGETPEQLSFPRGERAHGAPDGPATAQSADEETEHKAEGGTADVVSLDTFRSSRKK
ncbi:MAG: SspB family protein [Alphaproteobacteria bacterium]